MIDSILEKLKNTKYLSKYLTPESLGQLVRYLVTGFSSASIELTLLFVFKDVANLSILVSNSIALTIVFWFTFS